MAKCRKKHWLKPKSSLRMHHITHELFCFNQCKHLISTTKTFFINFLHFMLLGPCPSEKAKSLVFVDPNMLCISDHVSKVVIEVMILILTDVV